MVKDVVYCYFSNHSVHCIYHLTYFKQYFLNRIFIYSVYGSYLDGSQKLKAVLAIVENLEDHGLFVYTVNDTLGSSPSTAVSSDAKNLVFVSASPIDNTFQYGIESSQPSGISGGVIVLRVENRGRIQKFELSYSDQLKTFLSELKRTVQLSTQNSGFGLPSTFDWMDKYRSGVVKTGKSSLSPETSGGGGGGLVLADLLGSDPFLDAGKTGREARGSSVGKNTEWPFSEIIQLSADGKCPVVKDMAHMPHSSSDQNLKESVTRLQASHSQNRLNVSSATPSSSSNKSMRRSYDRNLNAAGSRDNSVPRDSVRKLKAQSARDRSPSLNNGMGGSGAREFHADLLMKSREKDYTTSIDYRFFCGTYNVNGQAAQSSLSEWLTPDGPDSPPPDIYAVGFQELDLSTNAYIFSESSKEEEWLKKVKEALHPRARYKLVKLTRLVGMMIVVFVKEQLYGMLQDILGESVGTGLLGMVGNKGGVAVRFRMSDTSICFVNSHLAAHMDEYERRNQDFRDITSRMSFKVPTGYETVASLSIADHDLVFWLGDLNYRISEIEADECKRKIKEGKFSELMNYDQLVRQISLRRVFLDFTEGQINFTPTYKYDPGTDNFDTSEKCRTPAWCDRILTRGSNIRQLQYRSHPQLRISDHKPVSALYTVGIKKIDPKLERKVREEVMKVLDQRENEFLPQVKLDVTEVSFKDVKYIELQRQQIQVTNTGQVLVKFELINKPGDAHYCKPWLTIDPPKGIIRPDEKTTLNVEVYITKETAAKLNSGEDSIEDIVVLHLEGGKDFFISVTGNYSPSCFGSSIETLVKAYGSVRNSASELIKLDQSGGPRSPWAAATAAEFGLSFDGGREPLPVPKELWRLVDHLYRYGLDEDELFQQPGHQTEITRIRDCLDTGEPAGIPGTVHSVAESFISFLEALADPVIPFSSYQRCVANPGNFESCKLALSQIPQSHRNVFKYVCAFLRTLLVHKSRNKLEIKFLATLFGGVLMRVPPELRGSVKQIEENRKCAAFIYNFLNNEYDD